MPAKKQTSVRLSDQSFDTMQQLADKLDLKRPGVIELALTHLARTLYEQQPVHHTLPPDDGPKSHKRPKRAA